MQPEVLLSAEVRQVLDGIDRASVDRASRSYQTERLLTSAAILAYGGTKQVQSHAEASIGRNLANVVETQSKNDRIFLDAAMRLFGRIYDEWFRKRLQTRLPEITRIFLLDGCCQRHQRRHRAATGKKAAGTGRVLEKLGEPGNHLSF